MPDRRIQGACTLIFRAFFSEIAQGTSAKTVWRSMRAEQAPSRSDGGDPAAIPNTRNGEVTHCKPLKNALEVTSLMANAIRILAIDAVQKANSGHPGMPMGMAEIALALWHRHLKHNPANPHWPDRDRFIVS